MKCFGFLSALCASMFFGGAMAADLTIYYSPSCPHCHHALDFISNELIYEYPDIIVTTVDATESENRSEFMDAVKKCKFDSYGVPVLVIGKQCFQGFGDYMRNDFRHAVEVDLKDSVRKAAQENRKALAKQPEEFRASHAQKHGVIYERVGQKKSEKNNNFFLLGVLITLLLGGGLFFAFKNNKK
ncbi:MAG: LPXTG cell wall anchor domain-containing protein [Alphaproteobacteria bacterium]|nr:LPXTG cell wall anchor domain-containing protein [Alphaproteobacteria bacterium]